MNRPLVSCIMPTKDRREFAPQSIMYFLRQTYPNKELVIGDDGEEWLGDFLNTAMDGTFDPARGPIVHYRRFKPGQTLGAKRNALVEACTGNSIICHWDDDDWYGPNRIERQVAAMQAENANVCGLDCPRFYDLRTGRTYRYDCGKPYIYSATLMYTRKFWERSPFPDVQVGASTPFVWKKGRLNRAAFMADVDWFLGMAHAGNNSPKDFTAQEFKRWPVNVMELLGADFNFYRSMAGRLGVAV